MLISEFHQPRLGAFILEGLIMWINAKNQRKLVALKDYNEAIRKHDLELIEQGEAEAKAEGEAKAKAVEASELEQAALIAAYNEEHAANLIRRYNVTMEEAEQVDNICLQVIKGCILVIGILVVYGFLLLF